MLVFILSVAGNNVMEENDMTDLCFHKIQYPSFSVRNTFNKDMEGYYCAARGR